MLQVRASTSHVARVPINVQPGDWWTQPSQRAIHDGAASAIDCQVVITGGLNECPLARNVDLTVYFVIFGTVTGAFVTACNRSHACQGRHVPELLPCNFPPGTSRTGSV